MTLKHYKPGDPEFEELCRKITPLDRIRKGLSQESNGLCHGGTKSGWKMVGTDRGTR